MSETGMNLKQAQDKLKRAQAAYDRYVERKDRSITITQEANGSWIVVMSGMFTLAELRTAIPRVMKAQFRLRQRQQVRTIHMLKGSIRLAQERVDSLKEQVNV